MQAEPQQNIIASESKAKCAHHEDVCKMGPRSLVVIAICYELEGSEIESWQGQEILSSPHSSKRPWGPPSLNWLNVHLCNEEAIAQMHAHI